MFPYRGGGSFWIVPSLLPEEPSNGFEEFRQQLKDVTKYDIYERIYEFPFMPVAMFAHFISR